MPKEKRVEIGLTYIYGIGRSAADEILAATKINPDTRVKDLTKDEEALIRDYIDKTSPLRATCAVTPRSTSNALSRSSATAARVTARDCPCAASVPKRTPRTRKGPKRTVANKKK